MSFKSKNYEDYYISCIEGGCRKVEVTFYKTQYKTRIKWQDVLAGKVKDCLLPSIYGKGFIGEGIYKSRIKGKATKEYTVWSSMIRRCYSGESYNYEDCEVHTDWLNFQNFAKWYQLNYPRDGKDYHLDKDIKLLGNRIYSESACSFVTQSENSIFSNSRAHHLLNPEGVYILIHNLVKFCKDNNLSRGQMSNLSRGGIKQYKGWTKYIGGDKID